jgi:hypothetical protein
MASLASPENGVPAGYTALSQAYGLSTLENWHESWIRGTRKLSVDGTRVVEYFPAGYAPGQTLGEQLEFALKYDGVNLEVLAALFAVAPSSEIAGYIQPRPTGKYARIVWYLYELLTGQQLPLDDLPATGNYVSILESDKYYTAAPIRVRRQRVNDNLLGDAAFCPTVRQTAALTAMEQTNPAHQCRDIIQEYSTEFLKRALSYLYTKETKSSFEIEHQTPDPNRTERFVALLRHAEQEDFVTKAALIELQNRTVDKRFQDTDYRETQNYIGQTVAWREKIHYIPPKPADLSEMMNGLLKVHSRASYVHPVVHAGVISFSFVYFHPFEDGNGRIHRFLIHNVLARRGLTPPGFIFPISAALLRDRVAYDEALEHFSAQLLPRIEYQLDEGGQMTVSNETAIHYRYMDLTIQIEALANFIQRTIDAELPGELDFLKRYDTTKAALQEIVDMPDRMIDRFIHFCWQNNGQLSARKRQSHFEALTDSEVQAMEQVVAGEPPGE